MFEKKSSRPWYRMPLVWMLIIPPLGAVIGGIITIYLAVESSDGLVKDDYYTYGKQINRVLERDKAATRLGLSGQFLINTNTNSLVLKMTGTKTDLPGDLQLSLLHATRAGNDVTVTLSATPDGHYHALIPSLAPGHWYAQLVTEQWRLTGDFQLPGQTLVKLKGH